MQKETLDIGISELMIYKLYPSEGYIDGLARTFDCHDNLVMYNTSSDHESADKKALTADFLRIVSDMHTAMQKYMRTFNNR